MSGEMSLLSNTTIKNLGNTCTKNVIVKPNLALILHFIHAASECALTRQRKPTHVEKSLFLFSDHHAWPYPLDQEGPRLRPGIFLVVSFYCYIFKQPQDKPTTVVQSATPLSTWQVQMADSMDAWSVVVGG